MQCLKMSVFKTLLCCAIPAIVRVFFCHSYKHPGVSSFGIISLEPNEFQGVLNSCFWSGCLRMRSSESHVQGVAFQVCIHVAPPCICCGAQGLPLFQWGPTQSDTWASCAGEAHALFNPLISALITNDPGHSGQWGSWQGKNFVSANCASQTPVNVQSS